VEQDYAEGLVELERIIRAATADGIPPAAALTELGRQLRASVAGDQLERARRCAVSTVAPLGLCFLPAFVLVAVAPVVMAAFQQMNG
jgi:hypothetical protein